MKKRVGLALLLCAGLLSSKVALADVLTHQGAKVKITVPTGWTQKQSGDVLQISSPDGAMSVVFLVMPQESAEKVFVALDGEVEKALGKVTWANDGKETEEDINGMSTWEWNGSAKGGSIDVDVLWIDTPATDKALGVYWFADASVEKKYKAAVDTIVKGLQPIK